MADVNEKQAPMGNTEEVPEQGTFTIYQLKSGEELHYHRFEPLERLERCRAFRRPGPIMKRSTPAHCRRTAAP